MILKDVVTVSEEVALHVQSHIKSKITNAASCKYFHWYSHTDKRTHTLWVLEGDYEHFKETAIAALQEWVQLNPEKYGGLLSWKKNTL